jgi:lactoylglutathione lyase/glyoxylase I family protein
VNPAGERYGFILASGSGTFVEFFRSQPQAESIPGNRNFRHLCFQVSDIQSFAEMFRQRGIEVSVTIGKTDRVPQFWVSDPDGTAVEFHEYSNPGSPQFSYV